LEANLAGKKIINCPKVLMTDLKQIEKESRMQLREPSFQEELNKCKNGPKVPGLGTRHTKKYVFLVTDFELV
jgi:hypothetical protein